ncbi:MAG: OST-HTH/LOTUS domain-containing protein, partial [Bacteroidetes bacterium]|nr:OST-HTH/LOTUS domain-containing protein [Bacteroidota bacterium]
EILKKEKQHHAGQAVKEQPEDAAPAANSPLNKIGPEITEIISDSVDDLADENGWTFLGELGSLVLKKKPDFDPRNYGYVKMLPLIRSLNKFEIDERDTGKKNVKHIYIRKNK